MAGHEIRTNEHMLRTTFWSDSLKTLLNDELYANKFVRILNLPGDAGSSVYNIPSLGEAEQHDFVEGARIKYGKLDEGNYTFTPDKYVYSAHSVSNKYKRDSYYADQVVAQFLPRQHRAIMVGIETRILEVANSGQTASTAYGVNPLLPINGANHRWIGSGTNETISLKDFALAQNSLRAANVPMTNLVAIVHPSVVYALQTQANLLNLMSPMPKWGNMVSNNTPTGTKFEMNIYGFDVYSSNYLPTGIAETLDGKTTTVGAANYFFHAATDDTSPWVGAFTQMPTVESDYNMDTQETRYLTICEYGFQGDFRPENLVTIITDTDKVV